MVFWIRQMQYIKSSYFVCHFVSICSYDLRKWLYSFVLTLCEHKWVCLPSVFLPAKLNLNRQIVDYKVSASFACLLLRITRWWGVYGYWQLMNYETAFDLTSNLFPFFTIPFDQLLILIFLIFLAHTFNSWIETGNMEKKSHTQVDSFWHIQLIV